MPSTDRDEIQESVVRILNMSHNPLDTYGCAVKDLTDYIILKKMEAIETLHHNIDASFSLIERIQPGYTGSTQIDARDLQKLICEYEDDLSAQSPDREEDNT